MVGPARSGPSIGVVSVLVLEVSELSELSALPDTVLGDPVLANAVDDPVRVANVNVFVVPVAADPDWTSVVAWRVGLPEVSGGSVAICVADAEATR